MNTFNMKIKRIITTESEIDVQLPYYSFNKDTGTAYACFSEDKTIAVTPTSGIQIFSIAIIGNDEINRDVFNRLFDLKMNDILEILNK